MSDHDLSPDDVRNSREGLVRPEFLADRPAEDVAAPPRQGRGGQGRGGQCIGGPPPASHYDPRSTRRGEPASVDSVSVRDSFLRQIAKIDGSSSEAVQATSTAELVRLGALTTVDEPTVALSWRILSTAPAWLFSVVLHLTTLVVLAVVWLKTDVQRDLTMEMVFGATKNEVVDSLDVSAGEDEIDQTEVIVPEEPMVEVVPEPNVAPPQIDVVGETGRVELSKKTAPAIGNALSGRDPGRMDELARLGGNGAATQGAVALGLKWLKRQQRSGGHWSLRGPYRNGAGFENRIAATSMALLAFQGAGNTHQRGTYRRAVRRGADFLIKELTGEGDFCRGMDRHQRLYSQAQATIAICELFGMSKDQGLRAPAQAAIDYAVGIQDSMGGWRYEIGQDSDTSVTGWFVMALKSAEMAGLEVPPQVYANISRYLDRVASYDGSRYAYRPGREMTEAMTAEALLCRQYLGWTREDGRLRDGVNYLLLHPINYRDENSYYWYYATQVMHNIGGDEWRQWNAVMREQIPNRQTKSGRDSGSWRPMDDRWGQRAGRLYTTCLSVYMLEVYYRHMPVYSAAGETNPADTADDAIVETTDD